MRGDYEAVNGFRVLVGVRRSQSQRAKEGPPQAEPQPLPAFAFWGATATNAGLWREPGATPRRTPRSFQKEQDELVLVWRQETEGCLGVRTRGSSLSFPTAGRVAWGRSLAVAVW